MSATGLAHRFGSSAYLFDGLDLEVRAGEVVALVGPSGSGKSTLLSILAGWVTPTRGQVVHHGIARTGWVFQNPHGSPRRSALDHVVLPLLAHGRTRRAAEPEAHEIMARFDVEGVADRPFRALSGGEAQRLMLARAVATAPDLLLVDEPTAQLDLATSATVNRVLAQVGRNATAVVVATHDPATREACTRVIDLADHMPAMGVTGPEA
ncbi:ABC transporter ATP-binding protein [Isoptericola dokdonensis]|uniref:ABC transporter ATP-binding protein n=1 Tax=Isoptericola dokdonensis TaxID=372663 RepID=UPI001E5DFAD8|nr:ATP-binding cassette domain-containing protein [Isoptericola dokdonensis]